MNVFTDQAEIMNQMQLAWPILLIFVVFDTAQGVASAVIKGTGQQRIGAIITSTAYWAFGIPIALILVYAFNFGIRGLWSGALFAVVYNMFCYNVLIKRIDWVKLIAEVKERNAKDKGAMRRGG